MYRDQFGQAKNEVLAEMWKRHRTGQAKTPAPPLQCEHLRLFWWGRRFRLPEFCEFPAATPATPRNGGNMQRTLGEIEAIVRDKICRVCSDRTVDGNCGLEHPSGCALFRLFPQVAKAIQSVHSDDINDYIQAIRLGVCSVCNDQMPDGSCETRSQVQCALDAYLLLVVDAIEEATGRKFDRTGAGGLRRPLVPMAVEVNL
jgi:hypothetical protein